jgi:hypothetical protein
MFGRSAFKALWLPASIHVFCKQQALHKHRPSVQYYCTPPHPPRDPPPRNLVCSPSVAASVHAGSQPPAGAEAPPTPWWQQDASQSHNYPPPLGTCVCGQGWGRRCVWGRGRAGGEVLFLHTCGEGGNCFTHGSLCSGEGGGRGSPGGGGSTHPMVAASRVTKSQLSSSSRNLQDCLMCPHRQGGVQNPSLLVRHVAKS